MALESQEKSDPKVTVDHQDPQENLDDQESQDNEVFPEKTDDQDQWDNKELVETPDLSVFKDPKVPVDHQAVLENQEALDQKV